MTLQAIADRLNEEGVPTVRGGAEWRPSSIQAAAGYKRRPRPRLESLPGRTGRAGRRASGLARDRRRLDAPPGGQREGVPVDESAISDVYAMRGSPRRGQACAAVAVLQNPDNQAKG